MTATTPVTQRTTDFRDPWVWAMAAVIAALHLAVAGRYDFFRNELYFIACGRHPAFGYADQPPLVPLLAAATQLFDPNLSLLRLPAALAAAALLPVTAALTTRLGGTPAAARLAALAAAAAPGLTALTSTLGTSSFEPLAWTLIAYLLLRATTLGDRRAWLWAGLIAGLALATKYSAAIWLAGLALGVLTTPARRQLFGRPALTAAAIAAALGVPSLIWQALHSFPFHDVVAWHSAEGAYFNGSVLHFTIVQALAMNMLLAPLWLTGLIAPCLRAARAPARILAIAAVVTAIAVYTAHGKDYYLFPVYPALFASGAAAISELTNWVRAPWFALAAANAAFIAPITLPLLEPHQLRAYMDDYHLHPRPNEKAGYGASITQVFSDEFAWRDLETKTAAIYRALQAQDRAQTGIFAWNYGEAAALDFYGAADGLPRAMSADAQYYIWGPTAPAPQSLILVNADAAFWRPHCASLTEAARFGAEFAMPYENDRPIYLCRGLKTPLTQLWPQLKWQH